jgi:purine-nucleoside phosphorylase
MTGVALTAHPEPQHQHRLEVVNAAATVIRARYARLPDVAIVLGTGLGGLAREMDVEATVEYADIPGFPLSTVESHAGRLLCGTLGGKSVIAMQGRVHRYEGYSLQQVTFPVRVLRALGAETLVVSNACGGMREEWAAGDLMLIADHINLLGDNPLVGENDDRLGPRFPDLSEAYDPRLGALLDEAAARLGLALPRGVYACVLGPSYETPAEVRMLRAVGADLVGMSTVPEVIAARHMGVPVAGLSVVTNHAAGLSRQPLSHEEVAETAGRVRERLTALLEAFLPVAVR